MEKPVEIKAKYMTLEIANLLKSSANIAPTSRPENMDSYRVTSSFFIWLIETKYVK